MNAFMNALSAESNKTFTQNGAVTFKSSKSAVLDFFSQAAAMRDRSDEDLIQLFTKAFAENRLLAMKALFYLRDCRGGQGERRAFRVILEYLAKNYPDIMKLNFLTIPFYGRWDDALFSKDVAIVGGIQYLKDVFNDIVKTDDYFTLSMAKWLPSENASSKKSKEMAQFYAAMFGVTPRKYRKILSEGRKKLQIVESALSAKNYSAIDYGKVPSKAAKLYRKAFKKHDESRYTDYLNAVEKGEAKINASVTYPYEIVKEYLVNRSDNDQTLNLIWKALPNYVPAGEQALVVADVSGSMSSNYSLPLAVSISLAMYFAERNTHPEFKDRFITFSAHPALVKIQGRTLYEKIQNINNADWGMNTNLQAVFELILKIAMQAKVPQSDMPTRILICSDMEFDSATSGKTNLKVVREKYLQAGYSFPKVTFWNVNASSTQSPCTFDENGVFLVSGCSPSIFKNVMTSTAVTPYELMLEVLESDRYNPIKV